MRRQHLSLSVLGSSEGQEVDDTPGVTPLVVVPSDELDEVLVEGDTSGGIEDGGSGVASEVGGDDGVLSVLDDTLERTVSSSLHGGLDLVVRRRLLKADDEVDARNVDGGHTEGHTATNRHK